MTDVTAAYSSRAAEYARKIGTMDAVHPADREIVESWARSIAGRVVDAGCGPGHWTQYLSEKGVDVRGIDRVPEFIAHARSTYPTAQFDVGSIEAIDEPDRSLGGILSWFSTIHVSPADIAAPLAEFRRTLRVGGTLLLGHFDSDGAIEPFDHAVVPAYRWPVEEMAAVLERAGFTIADVHRRADPGQRPVAAVLCRNGGASAEG